MSFSMDALPAQLEALLAEMPEGARDCVLNRLKGVTADGYDDFLRNLLIAMGLEQMNAEFAPSEPLPPLPTPAELYAMDRASVRTYDADNRLHVAETNISKANVCPYIGREIPDYEALGLDPDKEYRLLRDPEELKKAAATFNNLPLLSRHVPVSAESHQPDLVIGSTGTDATFAAPYLRNSLVVWARDAIDAVEGGIQKELSSAYRYRADMTPGTFNGEQYDGVMRDIVGNHVALVREGRAGPDVVVGDEKPKGLIDMAKTAPSRKAALTEGALFAYLRPKLAQDAKLDFKPILANVTDANFKASKGVIVDRVKKATEGKLAQDADIGDLVQLLNGLEGSSPEAGIDAEAPLLDDLEATPAEAEVAAPPDDAAGVNSGLDELKAFLLSKGMSEEDIAAALALLAPAAEETVAEPPVDVTAEEPEAVDEDSPNPPYIPREEAAAASPGAQAAAGQGSTGKGGEGGQLHTILDLDRKDPNDMVTKPAMDAAIAAAVKSATEAANRVQREIRDAERAVRPYVGDLAMAHDSAEGVYRTALKTLGVKVDGVHPSAFPVILSLQPKAGEKQPKAVSSRVAMDSSSMKSFHEMFPDAARIRTM